MLSTLKEIIFDIYNIDDWNINSRSKLYIDARTQFAYKAHKCGYTLREIGDYFHKHYSTIINLVNNHSSNFISDNDYFFKTYLIDNSILTYYESLIKNVDHNIQNELNDLIENEFIYTEHFKFKQKLLANMTILGNHNGNVKLFKYLE